MKIVSARWTVKVNMVYIRCDCKKRFEHRADRWRVVCPFCGKRAPLKVLRQRIRKGDLL